MEVRVHGGVIREEPLQREGGIPELGAAIFGQAALVTVPYTFVAPASAHQVYDPPVHTFPSAWTHVVARGGAIQTQGILTTMQSELYHNYCLH